VPTARAAAEEKGRAAAKSAPVSFRNGSRGRDTPRPPESRFRRLDARDVPTTLREAGGEPVRARIRSWPSRRQRRHARTPPLDPDVERAYLLHRVAARLASDGTGAPLGGFASGLSSRSSSSRSVLVAARTLGEIERVFGCRMPGGAAGSGRRALGALVFGAGIGALATEITASRLLAPYFGSSTIVWANLIGIVLAALALGYWLGGRTADRRPWPSLLGFIVLAAAVCVAAIPFVAAVPTSR
jgi:hypothetical protein